MIPSGFINTNNEMIRRILFFVPFNVRKLHAAKTAICMIIFVLISAGCQTVHTGSVGHDSVSRIDGPGYAADRALIEDLQARYMFALDFGDLDKYVATFTEDGILDIGEGEWHGRDTIRMILSALSANEEPAGDRELEIMHPATGRHHITNIVLRIKGDTAYGRAYWFHMGNDNHERKAILDSYGHYEDVVVRVKGSWLFSKRRIYNEQVAKWAAPTENPSW
jgi:hypothetical protein